MYMALSRAVLVEAAAENRMSAVSIYYHVEKFYDNVDLYRLCEIALSMQAYLGRRFLRDDGCLPTHPAHHLIGGWLHEG